MKIQIFFLIMTFLFSVSTASADNLKLGGTEWPPYIGSNLKKQGIAAEIVTRIFKRAGHEVEFLFYPWKRTQVFVKTGKLDGLAIAWYTEKRTETMGVLYAMVSPKNVPKPWHTAPPT